MKKVFSIVTAVLMVATLFTGCMAGTKTFTCQGMTMTVPVTMKDVSSQSDFSDFTFTLDSNKIAIFGVKENFSDFDGQDMTLDDYAKAVIQGNGLDALAISRANKEYKYFRYEAEMSEGTYKYLAAVYMAEDCFWMIQVAALEKDYNETDFFEYLDSVKFE